MTLTNEEKENIKTYFLIKEGVEITEVTEFYEYLLLKPYGVIDFEDKIYTNKQIKQELSLQNNKIKDLSPLSNLSNLIYLDLEDNKITDISPLSSVYNLETLYIELNNIKDLSPISNLTNLSCIAFNSNLVKDISPLFNLTNLSYISASDNFISSEDFSKLQSKLHTCKICY